MIAAARAKPRVLSRLGAGARRFRAESRWPHEFALCGDKPFSTGGYKHGDPSVHVRITVTSATETLCGHLMPGGTVRSHHPISHFTIMVAPIANAAIKLSIDGVGGSWIAPATLIRQGDWAGITRLARAAAALKRN